MVPSLYLSNKEDRSYDNLADGLMAARHLRWHCTKSSDYQVRVRGAPSNCYGVNVMQAVSGAYM